MERTEPGDDERSLGDPAPRPEATERTKAREIDELRSVMGDIGARGYGGIARADHGRGTRRRCLRGACVCVHQRRDPHAGGRA